MKEAKTNGCGPDRWYGRLIPNLCFGECCNQHDIDYADGGDESDYADVENAFLTCMVAAAKRQPWFTRPFLIVLAHVYGFVTRTWGWCVAWNHRRKVIELTPDAPRPIRDLAEMMGDEELITMAAADFTIGNMLHFAVADPDDFVFMEGFDDDNAFVVIVATKSKLKPALAVIQEWRPNGEKYGDQD